jgi:hypothetical protein
VGHRRSSFHLANTQNPPATAGGSDTQNPPATAGGSDKTAASTSPLLLNTKQKFDTFLAPQ